MTKRRDASQLTKEERKRIVAGWKQMSFLFGPGDFREKFGKDIYEMVAAEIVGAHFTTVRAVLKEEGE